MTGVPKPGSVALKAWTAITGANVLAYRASGGRVGGHWKRRNPILLLEHVGRRSGKRRTTPLVYMRDGDDLVVAASRGGSDSDPGWLHNLRSNPNTTIQIGRDKQAVTARLATAPERSRLWPRLVEENPDYSAYEKRTSREIPIVLLSPIESGI